MATSEPRIPVGPQQDDITIYSHSPLFYWWPVWAVGFIMALLTYLEHNVMVIVPKGSKAVRHAHVQFQEGEREEIVTADAVFLPKGKHLYPDRPKAGEAGLPEPEEPKFYMSHNKNFGVLWAIVLLVIIFVSNVPLRGLWSIVIIVTVVLLATIFALLDWWTAILTTFYELRIQINMGAYVFISTVLFIIWAVTFYFFDRRLYMIFSSGQIRVCTEIGEGQRVFDAAGVVLQKQQNDIFRHWIIGMGAGDLVVRTGGPHPEHFDFPNVLFVGHRVKQIEQRLKSREVV
jgi:hypothetical protein